MTTLDRWLTRVKRHREFQFVDLPQLPTGVPSLVHEEDGFEPSSAATLPSSDTNFFTLPSPKRVCKPVSISACIPVATVSPRSFLAPQLPPALNQFLFRLGAYSSLAPPQDVFVGYEAERFHETSRLSLSQVPFVVSGMHNSDVSVLGFQNGDVSLINSDPSSRGVLIGEAPGLHPNAVRDISLSMDDTRVLSCSDISIKELDLHTNELVSDYAPNDDVGFRQSIYSPYGSLFAAGSQSGNVYLLDSRSSPQAAQTFLKAHRVDRKTCDRISALAWVNETMFASAGTRSDTVKLWDLRQTRKAHTVVERKHQSGTAGVCALAVDSHQRVWALGRGSDIFGVTAAQSSPIFQMSASEHRVSSFYSRASIVTGPSLEGTFLACSGAKGVCLFTLPSVQAAFEEKMSEPAVSLLAGHTRDATGLHWQQTSESLVSVGDDLTCRWWSYKPDLGKTKPLVSDENMQ